jgi:hypothetical protein
MVGEHGGTVDITGNYRKQNITHYISDGLAAVKIREIRKLTKKLTIKRPFVHSKWILDSIQAGKLQNPSMYTLGVPEHDKRAMSGYLIQAKDKDGEKYYNH